MPGCRFIALVPVTACLLILACIAMVVSVSYHVRSGATPVDEKEIDDHNGDSENGFGSNRGMQSDEIDVK